MHQLGRKQHNMRKKMSSITLIRQYTVRTECKKAASLHLNASSDDRDENRKT